MKFKQIKKTLLNSTGIQNLVALYINCSILKISLRNMCNTNIIE